MIKKILLWFAILFSMFNFSIAYWSWVVVNYDIDITEDAKKSNNVDNDHLDEIWRSNGFARKDIESNWVMSVYELIVTIAKYLKNLFYTISWIFFLIVVIKFFADKWEEGFTGFKKWVFYISLWIVVMQFAFFFANVVFWKITGTPQDTFTAINEGLFLPLIQMMAVFAAIVFIIVAIMAFIRVIVSAWEPEKAKQWYYSIIFAILWVLLVLFAKRLVEAFFKGVSGGLNPDTWYLSWLVFKIIVRINSFIWLAVVILIIYSWAQILLSWWDQEKLSSWLKTVVYAFIWMFIIAASFLILTFFTSMPTT